MDAIAHRKIRLIALDGCGEIVVGRTPLVIGRHCGCDFRLGSSRVSRHHCCLSEVDGVVVVRDLGSTNGLRINGQRVTWGRLRPGDRLSIADFDFRLEVIPQAEVHDSRAPHQAGDAHRFRAGR
jgi:pSer/pThr/pTyr-binding forkhead associated (FHA) protein